MPSLLLEPITLTLPPLMPEPVVAPTIVAEAKPPEPDINELAAQLLDAAATHLSAKGWVRHWGKRASSTCLVGSLQEVLWQARGCPAMGLNGGHALEGFASDQVAMRAFKALGFGNFTDAIAWNDSKAGNGRVVIGRLRNAAIKLRGGQIEVEEVDIAGWKE